VPYIARFVPGAAGRALVPARRARQLGRVRPLYVTPRLCVRAWAPADAPALKAAIDVSVDHLRPWMPWAADEPSPVEAVEARLARFADDFAAGRWWGYGLFAREADGRCGGRVVGGLGVHRARHNEQPPSVREVGYWLRADATGRGYMTEAVAAVVDAALAEPGVLAVEIRMDPDNRASARVPERLGFALRGLLAGNRVRADGTPADTLVWERRGAAGGALRLGTAADVPRLQAIRAAVRENRLSTPERVRPEDYYATVARGACWVWEDADGVQGFASGVPHDEAPGEATLWALFVHPDAEGRGAGSALLACATDAFWRAGHRQLTLTTGPGTRAEQLYRAAGWTDVGRTAGGEIVFRREL
jgi:RimJ/RimL family protein N-acetyltransferase/N-acetylglutamate synthase-like GNAT family acetyltransferase